MAFNNFPYTDMHELNLDWVIKTCKQAASDALAAITQSEETKQFVNDYFDNLDVQEEINTKINHMVTSGEFGNIVDDYVPNVVTSWLNAHITQETGYVIDNTLTVAGAAADAKATGEALTLYTGISKLTGWLTDEIIVTNQAVGTVISLTPTAKQYAEHIVVNCTAGEQFMINGEGASGTRLFCFVDASNKILLNTYTASLTNGVITAPANAAKLILNRWINAANGDCYRGAFVSNALAEKANRYKYLGSLTDFSNASEGLYAVSPSTQNIPSTFGGYGWLDVQKTSDGKTVAGLFRERGLPVFYAYNMWYQVFVTKKFSCIGDSWTEFNSTATLNWVRLLEAEGATCQNLGISGTGFAKPSSGGIYKDRISQIDSTSDNIIVVGSFNDMSAGVDIGTPTDTGTSSVMGYVNDFFDTLLSSHSGKNIYCISPAPWANYHYGIGRSDQYVNGLEEICKKKGIPFLNCYNTMNLRPWDAANLAVFYTNTSHVNNVGYNLLYAKYRQFILENMMRYY